uniref:Putative ovule protein n=1 Tax=Solanum chacoense TaxID=4108 RepID=A0A0V0GQY4_SOLCH
MVVSQKAGYASCSTTFNWKHHGHGCSAGYTGHIYSSFLCPSFSRNCSPGRSIDSFNIHDFAQSHCTTTFSITSEDITFSRENGLMILIPLLLIEHRHC